MTTGKDFNGKTIAVSALNDLSTVSVDAWIEKGGGDIKTVKFVELPVSAMLAAVESHRVDGAFILYPPLAEAMASGKVKAIGAVMTPSRRSSSSPAGSRRPTSPRSTPTR